MDLTYLLLAAGFLALLVWYLWWNRSAQHVRAAQRAFQRGDEAGTLAAFAKAEAAGRLDASATASYAYLSLKSGRTEDAAELLDKALTHGRRGKPLKLTERRLLETYQAMVLWKNGRLDEAVELLEQLLASGYRTTAVYGNLGYLLLLQGNVDRAEAVCREAVDWDPEGKVILDNLASVLLYRERWAEAAEVYGKLLALEPKFPEAWHGAGWAALKNGDPIEARQRWQHALTLPFHALTTVERPAIEKALAELTPKPMLE
jgi:tetratricopeptide (TPR) repeat protein